MPKQKAAETLFDQLSKTLETDGEELVSKLKVEHLPIACPNSVDVTCINDRSAWANRPDPADCWRCSEWKQ